MNKIEVNLPSDKKVTLYYQALHPAPSGHQMDVLSVLQLRKDGKSNEVFDMTYDRSVKSIAKQFANDVVKELGQIDVMMTPPSDTNQFEPYKEQFIQLGVPFVSNQAIVKTAGKRSGDGMPWEELRAHYQINEAEFANFAECDALTCCILDDIFGDGKTAAAVIDCLEHYLPQESTFVLACPLRIDPTKTLPAK